MDKSPIGKLMSDPKDLDEALENVVYWARRLHSNWESEPHAHLDADTEYSSDELAIAARELVRFTELQERGRRPAGWNDKPQAGLLPVKFSQEDLERLIAKLHGDDEVKDLMWRLIEERNAFYRHGPRLSS